jgi:hypothetical protein
MNVRIQVLFGWKMEFLLTETLRMSEAMPQAIRTDRIKVRLRGLS